MISAPTDRLHKFLAISGLLVFAFGVKIGVDAYHDSELKKIEFMNSFRPAQDAYGTYVDLVNEAVALHNKTTEDPTDKNRKALKDYLDRVEKKQEELLSEAKALDNTNITDLERSEHYRVIRNIWLLFSVLAISIGSIVSYIGFSQWLKQPKKTR